MFVLEFKVNPELHQIYAIEEAIRTTQFVRNKALRYWIDNRGIGKVGYVLLSYGASMNQESPSL